MVDLNAETWVKTPMVIPADYKAGHEKARQFAPDIADNYVSHILIGDPLAEAMTEDLAELGTEESTRLMEAAMNREGEEALRDAPASLRKFFSDAETPPEWLDYASFAPAVRTQVSWRHSSQKALNEHSKVTRASGVWGKITVTERVP